MISIQKWHININSIIKLNRNESNHIINTYNRVYYNKWIDYILFLNLLIILFHYTNTKLLLLNNCWIINSMINSYSILMQPFTILNDANLLFQNDFSYFYLLFRSYEIIILIITFFIFFIIAILFVLFLIGVL